MTILLPTLAVTFAALCVWLTVRIVNRRERWAKWTLVVLVVPVLYVASFGPVCWATKNDHQSLHSIARLYRPIVEGAADCPQWILIAFIFYAGTDDSGYPTFMRLHDELVNEMMNEIRSHR